MTPGSRLILEEATRHASAQLDVAVKRFVETPNRPGKQRLVRLSSIYSLEVAVQRFVDAHVMVDRASRDAP